MLHLLDKSFFLCSLLCVILSDFVEVFEYINELMWIRFKKIPGGFFLLFIFSGFCLSLARWQGKEGLHPKRTEITHLDGQEKMGIDAGLSSGILELMVIF